MPLEWDTRTPALGAASSNQHVYNQKVSPGRNTGANTPKVFADSFAQEELSPREKQSAQLIAAFPFGHLKRQRGNKIDLIDIQLHLQKEKFVINFGIALPSGVAAPHGHLSQTEVSVADLTEQCRLYSSRRFMTWFGPSTWLWSTPLAKVIARTIEPAFPG